MRKLSNAELHRPTVEQFAASRKKNVAVVLDNIRSLNNVGSFFRTADAFAVEKIVLCGMTATPPSKEIHKTALGAELTVEWEYCASTLEAVDRLNQDGWTTVAIEQVEGATMLGDFEVEPTKRYALVFGNEVEGVDQRVVDLCNCAIEIPQSGTKHSLNVAVSGGVVLWQFYNSGI